MLASEITKRFKEQVRDESSKAFANRCRQLFTAVINTTPIDEGEASGNWQTRLTSTSKEVNRHGKEAAIAEVNAVLTDDYFKKNKRVYFINNTFHAWGLEYGNPTYTNPAAPFSSQAPNGMLRINVKNFYV